MNIIIVSIPASICDHDRSGKKNIRTKKWEEGEEEVQLVHHIELKREGEGARTRKEKEQGNEDVITTCVPTINDRQLPIGRSFIYVWRTNSSPMEMERIRMEISIHGIVPLHGCLFDTCFLI